VMWIAEQLQWPLSDIVDTLGDGIEREDFGEARVTRFDTPVQRPR
jgi:hypothetical protein